MNTTYIFNDFKKYKDHYGLVQPKPNHTSGNGLRYTGDFVAALFVNKKIIWTSKEMVEEREAILKAVKACAREPGLYMRTPKRFNHQQGPDDYVGLGTISCFLYPRIAQEILHYGRNQKQPKYNYNTVTPGKLTGSSWLGRQQQLIAHWQFAAGEMPNPLRWTWWYIAIIIATFSKRKNQDGWVLAWHLVLVGEHRSRFNRWIAKWFRFRLKQTFPKGIGQCLGEYFGDFSHPLAKYLLNQF